MSRWVPAVKYILYALVAALVFERALASQKETSRLLHERGKIRSEIARLHQENGDRQKILNALTSDPFYVERILRERYGYAAPDEEDLKPARPDSPRPTPTRPTPRPRTTIVRGHTTR